MVDDGQSDVFSAVGDETGLQSRNERLLCRVLCRDLDLVLVGKNRRSFPISTQGMLEPCWIHAHVMHSSTCRNDVSIGGLLEPLQGVLDHRIGKAEN